MAIPKVKATYSLDVETVRALEAMARRLGVSRSEALRRAVMTAAKAQQDPERRLAALRRLRKRLALTPEKLEAWLRETRQLRRESDRVERLWGAVPPPRRVAEAPARERR